MVTLVNRAKMSTATTGTGTITLGSAVAGFQSFAAAGVVDGDVVRYVIEDGTDFEIGTGTFTASGTTLTRTVSESSNADAALNLTGNAVVFVGATAADIQQPPFEGAFVDGDKTKLDNIEAGAQVNVSTNLGLTGTGNTRTITSSTGTNVTIPVATNTTAGWLSTSDKTKLDGIAAGAQVNVGTNLTYSTAATTGTVSSSTGTNATIPAATTSLAGLLTGADKTKLNGLEAGADVTDTANVTASGALMDSEVTNLAAVKAFDPTDYATAAQGSLADTATQPGDSISTLTNDAGYTTNTGTVTSVAASAGTGISITGSPITTSGTLTITNTAPHISTNLAITGTGNTRTITSSTGTNVTIPVATGTTAGWLSTTDKTKLDGIATGAQVNVATNLGYTTAASTGTVTSSNGTNATLPAATTTLAGLLTGADKTKLDGIASGATANSGTVTSVAATSGTGISVTGSPVTTSGTLTITNTAPHIATDLSATAGTTAGPSINSSTGTNVVIPSASATASGIVTTGTQTFAGAKTFSSTITGSVSGNAGTATALQTARTIGGVSFNGTANINLPSVNTVGNQNTTGSAATLTTARTLTIGDTGKTFNGSANVAWSLAEIGVNDATLTLATSGIATGSQTFTANQGTAATFTVNVPATNLGQGGSGNSRTITSSTGSNVTVSTATTSNAGFMSTGDKTKLNGIAAGAQVNVATNLSYTGAATTGTVASSTGTNATLPAATTSVAGLLTGADKTKLNGIATGAQVNVATNLSITNGTTAGPRINSSTGANATFPTASGTISGAVTTGTQTFAGTKTFSGAVILGQAGTATNRAVRADRNIATGTGLSGGGNLTANRTFSIDIASQAEAEAGTNNTKVMTPLRASQTARRFGNPAGTIIFYAADTAPDGYLKANGAAISRTTFAALFAAIGTTYGAGNGSTTFNLPDMRGEFPRGFDDGRGVDSGRGFGSAQLDQMQRITGRADFNRARGAGDPNNVGAVETQTVNNGTSVFASGNNDDGLRIKFNSANSPDARVSADTTGETRSRNVALLACIKF